MTCTDMPNQPNPLFNMLGLARWLWLVPWKFSSSIGHCWLCWPTWRLSTWSRCSHANRTLPRSFCKAKSSLRGPRVSAGTWVYSPKLNQTSCGHRLYRRTIMHMLLKERAKGSYLPSPAFDLKGLTKSQLKPWWTSG